MRLITLGFALLVACDDGKAGDSGDPGSGGTDTADTTSDTGTDNDADGFNADIDCDDTNPDINPDADELCDGIDNNCDGNIDEGLQETWHTDADGDGYGDPDESVTACSQPAGAVADGTDCDDGDPNTSPAAQEVCDDAGDDEDCDGLVDDEDDSVANTSTWYADMDGDGYGDPNDTIEACEATSGYISNGDDCDDTVEGTGCWSGTWAGDIDVDLTIATLGITDACSGTVTMVLDTDASPVIDGSGSCATTSLGTISFDVTGDIDEDGNIDAVADATGFFSLDWTGTITSTALTGSGTGRDSSLGFEVVYALKIAATPSS